MQYFVEVVGAARFALGADVGSGPVLQRGAMIRVHRLFCALAILGAAKSAEVAAQSAPPSPVRDRFVGEWQGVLVVGASKLRIALSVKRDSAAGLRGQMVSIDQGGAVIPAQMSIRGDTLVVSIPAASGTYTAVATPSGDSLHGVWSQGSPLPLAMGRGAAPVVVAKARPQDPKPPFPYRSQEITVASVAGAFPPRASPPRTRRTSSTR